MQADVAVYEFNDNHQRWWLVCLDSDTHQLRRVYEAADYQAHEAAADSLRIVLAEPCEHDPYA